MSNKCSVHIVGGKISFILMTDGSKRRVAALIFLNVRKSSDRHRPKEGEDTSARDLGLISPSVRRQNNSESECERGTACLKYTNQVQYQPKILLLTSQCHVLISSTQGLCNITTSVYNYGVITVHKQGGLHSNLLAL